MNDEIAFEQELESRISSEAVKAIAIRLLSPEPPTFCPQYQVFRLARKPSGIFNLNVDRLARLYCTGHKILDLHGTAPSPEFLHSVGWHELEDGLLEFSDLRAPSIPGFVHIGPEPSTITQTRSYICAMQLLPRAKYVVFVGYAFGGMDDIYTYNFLCAHLRRHSTPVVVIDLNPSDLVLRIQDEVKSAKVYGLEADWSFLAQAIIETARVRRHKWCSISRLCPTCVSYSYERLQDKGGL